MLIIWFGKYLIEHLNLGSNKIFITIHEFRSLLIGGGYKIIIEEEVIEVITYADEVYSDLSREL